MSYDSQPEYADAVSSKGERLGLIEQLISDLTDVEKLDLIARVAHSVQFKKEHEERVAEIQKKNMLELIEKLENIPLESDQDEFSGQHHDQVLYGWTK